MSETTPRDRRSVLRLGGVALLGGLAGCSAPSSRSPMPDLTPFDQTESPSTVELAIFRRDDRSRSEARRYAASIDVAPQGTARRTDVAAAKPSLVRYSAYAVNRRLIDQDHVHCLPDDDPDHDGLAFDIQETGTLTRR